MSKDKLIPELRFPEFANKEWKIRPIENFCDVYRGSTFSKSDMKEDGTEQCIHYGELFTKYNEVITKVISRTDKQDGFRSEVGDVLMPSSDVTPDGLARASAITEGNVVLGGDMNILRPYEGVNSIFFSYLLNHSKREIIKLVSGTTVKHIYPSQIITCELPVIANVTEQKKIAFCLSSLDELLTAHKDKLLALKNHKKGLLQNLLPQEGETAPRVRFPEFEGDGEWTETTLEQVANYQNGKAHEKDIDENGDYIVVNSKFISTEGETVKFSDTSFCPAHLGDVLMVLSDVPNGKAIAKCFYVDEDDKYSVNQRICRITATDCDSRFLFYMMDRNTYFLSFDDGVKQTNLRKTDVLEFPFRIPTDPDEQKKIASCISAVDELIKGQTEKIDEMNQHKRGLMQGLFPKIES